MILFAALLSAAAVAAPPPQAVQARTVQSRKAQAKRRVARARLPVLRAVVLTQPKPDASARYRITSTASVDDAKLRAAADPGMACEVTGAPVCPSKPRKVITADLVND